MGLLKMLRTPKACFAMSLGLFFLTHADAKVLEHIPSHYVKVGIEEPAADAPGQLKKALAYLDGPVLRFRGTWSHPDDLDSAPVPRSPVPELVVPVRVAIPGAYKFIDLESNDSVLGEVAAETFTPEARVYRVYLPITAMRQRHRFDVVFHSGLPFPLILTTRF